MTDGNSISQRLMENRLLWGVIKAHSAILSKSLDTQGCRFRELDELATLYQANSLSRGLCETNVSRLRSSRRSLPSAAVTTGKPLRGSYRFKAPEAPDIIGAKD